MRIRQVFVLIDFLGNGGQRFCRMSEVLDILLLPLRVIWAVLAFPARVMVWFACAASPVATALVSPLDRQLFYLHERFHFFPNLWDTDLCDYQKARAVWRFESAVSLGLAPFLEGLAAKGRLVDWLLTNGPVEVPPEWLGVKADVKLRTGEKSSTGSLGDDF